jgi:AraC family transcriptional regulator
MKVDIVEGPKLRLASVRHVGSYQGISEAFQRLNELVTAAGLSNRDTKLVGIYHDDPSVTPENKLRSDAAITIPATAKLPPGLTEQSIPAGRYAHAIHTGPYTGLGAVYAHLRKEWLPLSGEKARGSMSFEMYRNTPMTAKPHELVTDVYMPLR